MKSSKGSLALGLATGVLIFAFAPASGMQRQSNAATAHHTKRQSMDMRKRYSAHRFRASAKKMKRVPRAKSLSKESY